MNLTVVYTALAAIHREAGQLDFEERVAVFAELERVRPVVTKTKPDVREGDELREGFGLVGRPATDPDPPRAKTSTLDELDARRREEAERVSKPRPTRPSGSSDGKQKSARATEKNEEAVAKIVAVVNGGRRALYPFGMMRSQVLREAKLHSTNPQPFRWAFERAVQTGQIRIEGTRGSARYLPA